MLADKFKEMVWSNYNCENWDNPYSEAFQSLISEDKEIKDYADKLDEAVSQSAFLVMKTAQRVWTLTEGKGHQEGHDLIASCFKNPKFIEPTMLLYSAFERGATTEEVHELQPTVVKMIHEIFKP